MNEEARLYARCEAKLAELDIPVPFSWEAFIARLEGDTGRRIVCLPIPLGEGVDGQYIAGATRSYIFFDAHAGPRRRTQIITHEAAHHILGHRSRDLAGAEELAAFLDYYVERFGDDLVGLDCVRTMLGESAGVALCRSTYPAQEDREAEVLADLIIERGRALSRLAASASDPESAAILGRLEDLRKHTGRR